MKQLILTVLFVCSLMGNLAADDEWKIQSELYKALQKDDVKKLEAIIAKNPSLVKKQIKFHDYPVLDAASLRAFKSLKFLVEKGANINQTCPKTGNTVLHYLAMSKMKSEQLDQALEYCLNEKKMKLETKNKDGQTPFLYPFAGSRFPASGKTAIAIIEAFAKHKAKLNAQDKKGKTALHFLVSGFQLNRANPQKTDLNKKLTAAKFLADQKGVDVNVTDKDKRTPLVAFLVHVKDVDDANKVDFITCLMENGAKYNIRSKKKEKATSLVDRKSAAYKALKAKYKKKKK